MEYVKAKKIVTNTKSSSWFGTEYNMNIYRGCCHGCIYCDSRSECYHVEDFDRVKAKENALAIIRDDLKSKVKTGVIETGAMSDPYNPFEKDLELTRHSLELISAYDFGVSITTKSPLISRDIDILTEIKAHSPVIAKLTITTADDELCLKLEPSVAPSSKRFEALTALSEAGIYAGVLLMPILPFINDSEENILSIVARAKECGARFIYPSFGVTLRSNQREYYYEQLDRLFPTLKKRYISKYGDRYNCTSPKAKYLYQIFAKECERVGLLYKMQDIIRSYRLGYGERQFSLF